jgi:PAS domain-containing protein
MGPTDLVYREAVGMPLRVLIIEDLPDDAELVLRALSLGGYQCAALRVDTALAMSDALDREPWDLIISDYHLPGFDAPAALSLLQAHDLDIPFLLVSGTIGELAAVTAMKAGAHDYLAKGSLKRLVPAVARELQEAKNRAARRLTEQALRRSEARFRGLIEHIPSLVLVHQDGAILYVNASARLALGYAASEELLGRPLDAVIQHGGEGEQRWRGKHGVELTVRVSQQPIDLDGVSSALVVGTCVIEASASPLGRLVDQLDRAIDGLRTGAPASDVLAPLGEARQAADELRAALAQGVR